MSGPRRLTHEEFVAKSAIKNPNLEIISTYISNDDKVTYKCKVCGYTNTVLPVSITRGHKCYECGKRSVSMTQKVCEDRLLALTNGTIQLVGGFVNGTSNARFHCNACDGVFETQPCTILKCKNGKGCPYCYGKKVLVGFNDVRSCAPHVAALLLDPEDGIRYSKSSGQKTRFKCPICGKIYTHTISHVYNNGLSCSCMTPSMSYGERFVRSLLDKCEVEYIYDRATEWSENRRYDFIVANHIICEVMGGQHYESSSGFKNSFGRSVADEQRNDEYKKQMAIRHGFDYIAIDCRNSYYTYVRNNVVSSGLLELLHIDSSQIDWRTIGNMASARIEPTVFQMWNDGYSVGQIGKACEISTTSVYRYLRRGTELGLCQYPDPRPRFPKTAQ